MRDEPARGTDDAAQGEQPGRRDAVVTGAAYGVLAVLGFVVGVYGAVYYSVGVGGVPVGAPVAVILNFVMCRAAARAMRTRLAPALPAAGWVIAVVLLSAQRPEGDVLITNSTAAYVLLFGGVVAAVIAVGMSLVGGGEAGRFRARSDSATRG